MAKIVRKMHQTKEISNKINKMIAKLCISVEIFRELVQIVKDFAQYGLTLFDKTHQWPSFIS